jgi:asparagine synthase (glutamine-hydrolysing)
VGFEGAGAYDERPAARAVARRFGCLHHETVLTPARAMEVLPACVWHLDEPLGDATALATYTLAGEARRKVTVVLTGVGGDEVFAGYRRYQAERLVRATRFIPDAVVQRLTPSVLARLPASGRSRVQDLVRLARKFLAEPGAPLVRRYLAWNAAFTATEKEALLGQGDGADSLAWGEAFFRAVPEGPFPGRAQVVDLRTYLPHDPLALTDAMTMAWGLEARVPLCDHLLVEWALGLPGGLHVSRLRGKALLRRAMAGVLPRSTLRRAKRGFSVPTDLWLRGPLAGDVGRLLSPRELQPEGLFRLGAVGDLLASHRAGRRDASQHVWALLVFQVWYRLLGQSSPAEYLEEVG